MQYKKCPKCKEKKLLSDFYKAQNNTDGHASWCKKCTLARNQEHRYKTMYGISVDYANELLATGCHICGTTIDLCIDHCHDTGLVRGCLCRRCNMALGLFDDSADKLTKAIEHIGG